MLLDKIKGYFQRKKYGISNLEASDFDTYYFINITKYLKRFKEINKGLPYGFFEKDFYNSIKNKIDDETYNKLINNEIDVEGAGFGNEYYDFLVSKWNEELDKMILLFNESINKKESRKEAMDMLTKYINELNW